MKKISLLLLCIFSMIQIYAQTPDAFQYQAVIKNSDASAFGNKEVILKFDIHQKTAAGSVIFSETHQSTTNAAGIVNLQIGKGTAVHATLSQINWADGPYFIETLVDKIDGNGMVSTGTQQLLSVPFSKYAQNAENVQIKSPNGDVWNVVIDDSGNISTQKVTQ